MHSKIKEIRIRLGLSEAQVSSLLNVSSYKYRRYENGSLEISVDILVLLSIMYGIPIEFLIFDKYCIDMVFKQIECQSISQLEKDERFSILEYNICKCCTFKCCCVNYRVVKNVLAQNLKKFSENLYKIRHMKAIEVAEISSLIHVSPEHYLVWEKGLEWPSVYELVDLSRILSVSINDFI